MAADMSNEWITVSLVSHGHDMPVAELVAQIMAQPLVTRVVLTLNVPQTLTLPDDDGLVVINNATPKGFGENHNQAFVHAVGKYFVVLNPDVGLTPGLFDALVACQQATSAAVVAPSVLGTDGSPQNSWRRFPTVHSLMLKAMGRDSSMTKPLRPVTYPDWVAGMCMLFDANAFRQLGGFDKRYFLYYEDVDICARAWLQGMLVAGCSKARLVHDGQLASHRQWRHLRWHLASMLRYLWQYRGAFGKIVKPDDGQ